ncbi:MAG: HAMP domain-containing histidine kinase [Hyphomicrobium sp.]|jgi:signal transduction histidine kinase|nr:HAMP domain-containing histidine kinase [Hyphomicrobium sp.]
MVLGKLGASAWTSTPFRLAALSIAAFLLTAAGIVGFLFWQTNDLLTEQVLSGLRAEVQELRHIEAAAGSASVAEAVKLRARPDGPGLYFVADRNGRKRAGNLSRLPPELQGEGGGTFRYEREPGNERLAVALPVLFSDGSRLIVGRDIEEQREFANRMRTVFLLGFGLLSIAGLAGGLGAGRLLLNRIDQINAASRSIMAGDLSQRVPLAGTKDELDNLARNLNMMLDRIEQLMSGLREVSDNIAHDLKTPLSRLRNRAEATLRDGGDDCAQYRAGLERVIEEADELIKTFNAMLLVARLEAGALEGTVEPFDLGALVRDVAEFYEPVADEQGLELTVDAGDGPEIVANRHLVSQAVANLIDNAIKYGRSEPPGPGSIAVSVTELANDMEIAVADRGPGISAEDRERALKRFVRLEASRTKPGTGLGLSLVAAVARLHHGTVRLEDNAPGLRAVLVLPRGRAGTGA